MSYECHRGRNRSPNGRSLSLRTNDANGPSRLKSPTCVYAPILLSSDPDFNRKSDPGDSHLRRAFLSQRNRENL